MSFTRIANAERRIIASEEVRQQMADRGWCETKVPVHLLDELGIVHEVVEPLHYRQSSKYLSAESVTVYAPVWVTGVLRRTVLHSRPDILRAVLCATRDDFREQEMVSSELTMDLGSPELVRKAAHNYRYKRSG